MNVTGLDRLKSQLLTTGLQQKDTPLYQVINQLIEFVRQGFNETEGILNNIPGGSGTPPTQTYLTYENELTGLPFSRRLVAGGGINFNNDGQRLIISGVVLPGNDGEDGVDGFPGPTGMIGPTGSIGLSGPPGMDGECECICNGLPFGSLILPEAGVWSNNPYNSANFTGDGGMTWTVDSADQVDFSYTFIGRTMIVSWRLNLTSVGGVLSNELRLTVPVGKMADKLTIGTLFYSDNFGISTAGTSQILGGENFIRIYKAAVANWSASAHQTNVNGLIIFPYR